jgi:hypothetical protein
MNQQSIVEILYQLKSHSVNFSRITPSLMAEYGKTNFSQLLGGDSCRYVLKSGPYETTKNYDSTVENDFVFFRESDLADLIREADTSPGRRAKREINGYRLYDKGGFDDSCPFTDMYGVGTTTVWVGIELATEKPELTCQLLSSQVSEELSHNSFPNRFPSKIGFPQS